MDERNRLLAAIKLIHTGMEDLAMLANASSKIESPDWQSQSVSPGHGDACWLVAYNSSYDRSIVSIEIAVWLEHIGWCGSEGEARIFASWLDLYWQPVTRFADKDAARANFLEFVVST